MRESFIHTKGKYSFIIILIHMNESEQVTYVGYRWVVKSPVFLTTWHIFGGSLARKIKFIVKLYMIKLYFK